MSTLRKIEANRQNALKSTGPRSIEGKSRVRLNASKHGYCCADAILPGEDPGAYHVFAREIRECYNPRTALQKLLLEQVISLEWRLRRIMEAQVKVFDLEVARCAAPMDGSERQMLPCEVLAERFSDCPDNAFVLLNRYERSVRSAMFRTMHEYDRVTKLHPTAVYLDEDNLPPTRSARELASLQQPETKPTSAIEYVDFPSKPPLNAPSPDRCFDGTKPKLK